MNIHVLFTVKSFDTNNPHTLYDIHYFNFKALVVKTSLTTKRITMIS